MNLFIFGFGLIMALIILGCISVFVSISMYNKISQLALVREVSWQRIVKLLSRRIESLPAILRAIHGTAAFQDQTLGNIKVAYRYVLAARSINTRIIAENILSNALPSLTSLQKKYPDQQNNLALTNALKILHELEAELDIEEARFNAAAEAYNVSLKRFPASLFAAKMGYVPSSIFGEPVPKQVLEAISALLAEQQTPPAEVNTPPAEQSQA